MPAPAAVTVSPMLELEVALTQPEKRLSRADPILTSASIAAGVLANVRIKSRTAWQRATTTPLPVKP
jgi:hypothetical protein